jgi:flagella synthesis protein FlgN
MVLDGTALSRALQSESEALSAYIALLREEQRALVDGKLESLSSFADSKSICLFELNRLGEQRAQWLRERKLPANRAGLEHLLRDGAGGSPQSMAAWRQLLALTQTAQQLNDTNGTLIGSRLNGTQRALRVLFSAANIAGGYAPDGSTECVRSTHTLAVA